MGYSPWGAAESDTTQGLALSVTTALTQDGRSTLLALRVVTFCE